MKEQLYIIKCRYQTWASNGKEFTDWFVYDNHEYSEADGNEAIKSIKKDYKYIDDKTHLKHEYILVSADEYKKEQKEIDKYIKAAQKRDEKYFASDEWKELKHKKYVAKKERIAKQQEYNKMVDKWLNKYL